jgi:hypothetical protein
MNSTSAAEMRIQARLPLSIDSSNLGGWLHFGLVKASEKLGGDYFPNVSEKMRWRELA